MIVMKFGGTSLANAERIKKVGEIIKSRLRKKPIVVVSAVAGVTDSLINLAKESAKGKNPNKGVEEIINLHKKIIRELSLRENLIIDECVKLHDLFNGVYLLKEISPRSLDFIASFGEILSSKIIAEYLNYIGIKSTRYSGWEVGIISDDNFTNAEVLPETYERVKKFFKKLNGVPVVTGFIAKNRDNEITTLGRGGSDYTAAIIGAGLNVKEIEIWTDVDGIKTTDPKIVKGAKQWKRITFEEDSEMAY
ncbi:MAG: aspartate kinase, partial [Candidatus Pacearchaeota archaeon]